MRKLSRSKVLVTGAGGFIGSHLCELCLAEGADVRAFVHYNSGGFIAASNAPKVEGETIQLGSQREYSIAELVGFLEGILKRKLKVISDAGRVRPKTSEVERLFASNQNARERLDWQPEVPLNEGLERTVRWFRGRSGLYRNEIYHV